MVTSLNLCSSNDLGLDTSGSVDDAWEKAQRKELVLVEWVDIISDDGWVVAEDCDLPTFYTVGWLEYQDDRVIKICNTLDFDDALEEHKKKEKPIGYAVTCFPAGCVVSLSFLNGRKNVS
jgi:hypothetical protein